ncbi:hypothetical protein EV200_101231 [Pedobacter psychrotolerans]|uniref:Glycosyl transferase family 2 n=1 Tax=Pedobacter psychrotolerans TaxID=1843235 RepID=A0A4R2HME4_9SPHI|nr:hypothetical protein [Pedobacter psychrotolerans]TCO30792.1 hypothetical protein EV200_101231 [Pedobacter psychrotolerans]GGE44392.1 hypothetical protein GCM10011413_08150 [Pedobacter psychrotolerans]
MEISKIHKKFDGIKMTSKSTKIPILVPTFHKMESLLTFSLELLSYTWPNHGNIYIISDRNRKSQNLDAFATKIYRFPSDYSWVKILHEGVLSFQKNNPTIEHVYLILDDLLPLTKIDEQRINKIEFAFQAENWKYLYFPHYDNVCNYNLNIDSELFSKTERDYKYFTQIGAGLINVVYLIELCQLATDMLINSPWQFEFLKPQSEHIIAKYRWPSVRDGYSKSKFINPQAIKALNYPEGVFFRKKLQRTLVNQIPKKILAFLNQKIKNFKHKYL